MQSKNYFTFIIHYYQSCEDVNECVYPDACGPHSMCQNTVGAFQCVCNTGFVANSNGCVGLYFFCPRLMRHILN
jgi:hypothetical protein